MASGNGTNVFEEREEGEIVEDELEDISDCSINSPLYLGKSCKSPERLRAVSLSSISDSDVDLQVTPCRPILVKDKKPRRRHKSRSSRAKCKCKQKYKKSVEPSSESESEEQQLDQKTLRQLKEAVHVNTSTEAHQNSLRSRLKGLIEPAKSNSDDEVELNKLRTDALKSKSQDAQTNTSEGELPKEPPNNLFDSLDDKELTELRLEALKSAMIKKHLERKKRKLDVSNDEVDKENAKSGINVENENKMRKNSTGIADADRIAPDNNSSVEEDLDIMRAMLLASISKKMAKMSDPAPKVPSNVTEKPPIKSNNVANKYKLQKIALPKQNNFFNGKRSVVNNVKKNVVPPQIQPKLPPVAPLIIAVNNDSDSDMDLESPQEEEEDRIKKTVEEFLKVQRAKIEAQDNKRIEQPVEKREIFDKSVVKLLPLNRQKEYQMLKQKLLNHNKKVRVRKFSQTKAKEAPILKKVVKPKLANVRLNASRDRVIPNNVSNDLQRTIKDLQIQKDGRLQVKGKYQDLAQLLRKVNQVSVERNRYEIEIKKLLLELEKTKSKFDAAHQHFKNLVEELISKKAAIDRISEDNRKLVTSTPSKEAALQSNFHKLQESPIPEAIKPFHNIVEPLLDPNDITEAFIQGRIVETKAPKYESPLDHRTGSAIIDDPLATFCPYELLGVCKDKECAYNHCASY